ncbi:MAG: PIG-L family deacetylase [Flavisolibacter sp.]
MGKIIGSRRSFVKETMASLTLYTLPSILYPERNTPSKPAKVVVVGGHPDDPECGCRGTVAKLISMGHEITMMYFTNGDEGISGKLNQEAATIRKNESLASCRVLQAKPLFVGQVDGESVVGNPEMAQFEQLLYQEKPNIVFTHWPIDSHKDHQLASILSIQAWMEAQTKFSLYFYEVCTGNQTFGFHPTDYVDISDFEEPKKKALACHASQDIVVNGKYTQNMIDCGHPAMQEFRGRELGVHLAEAYVRMSGRGYGHLSI